MLIIYLNALLHNLLIYYLKKLIALFRQEWRRDPKAVTVIVLNPILFEFLPELQESRIQIGALIFILLIC